MLVSARPQQWSLSAAATALYDPTERMATYGDHSWAQYLLDLHQANATLDFCGGMMFQLVLTDALQTHLQKVAQDQDNHRQPVTVYDATHYRMHQIPDYQQNAEADNCHVFHGREIRNVPHAAGGMGMVLQLSYSSSPNQENVVDPQGWTTAEIQGYNGWKHDGGREWREGQQWAAEGYESFGAEFGPQAFGLHHRFYWHLDARNAVWLSAEDGCEGTPSVPAGAAASPSLLGDLGKLFRQL